MNTVGRGLAAALSSRQMRLYWSSDVVGAELGGAVKNVLAIAAGIVEGRGLGASAHAAIVTRGFAELRRFGEAMGARPETLLGLSGLGDLVLTCGSPQSRNMSLGRGLGEGKTLAGILGRRTAVTEGVYTAAAVVKLAREKGVEMPISEAVHAIIEGRLSVEDAITGSDAAAAQGRRLSLSVCSTRHTLKSVSGLVSLTGSRNAGALPATRSARSVPCHSASVTNGSSSPLQVTT